MKRPRVVVSACNCWKQRIGAEEGIRLRLQDRQCLCGFALPNPLPCKDASWRHPNYVRFEGKIDSPFLGIFGSQFGSQSPPSGADAREVLEQNRLRTEPPNRPPEPPEPERWGIAPPNRFRDYGKPLWPPCRPLARADRTGGRLITPLRPAYRLIVGGIGSAARPNARIRRPAPLW